MKRKETFSKLEKLIEKVPTWLFVTGEVILLAAIALWIELDRIHSFRDAVRVLFENAESIALVAAVILLFREAPSRKAQKHYEAWQVIDHAAAAKVPTSYARIQALQDLNQDDVSLAGVNLPEVYLQGINLQGANLIAADLRGADLVRANLSHANLSRANLSHAILIDANLSYANLSVSDLSGAILGIADLSNTDLTDADLSDANLSGADLDRALLHDASFYGADLSNADLHRADLYHTDFRQAKNLTLKQVKSARNWEHAIYDAAFCEKLGLPT